MVEIQHKRASSILSKATGFIDSYDYTLNPYSGCAFACSYCFAAFFAPTDALQDSWGQWVNVKENALDLLRKKRKRPLVDKTIYISSVTDPYQPVEKKLELTRAILRELLDYHHVGVTLQTRSPLVTRDIDLLRGFKRCRVQMTVTTDDENVRKIFEPRCPPNSQRIEAIKVIHEAGIAARITLTPLLPVSDPQRFAQSLLDTGVQAFTIQNFHATKARFVAGTGETARRLLRERGWNDDHYQHVKAALAAVLPNLQEGRDGFAP